MADGPELSSASNSSDSDNGSFNQSNLAGTGKIDTGPLRMPISLSADLQINKGALIDPLANVGNGSDLPDQQQPMNLAQDLSDGSGDQQYDPMDPPSGSEVTRSAVFASLRSELTREQTTQFALERLRAIISTNLTADEIKLLSVKDYTDLPDEQRRSRMAEILKTMQREEARTRGLLDVAKMLGCTSILKFADDQSHELGAVHLQLQTVFPKKDIKITEHPQTLMDEFKQILDPDASSYLRDKLTPLIVFLDVNMVPSGLDVRKHIAGLEAKIAERDIPEHIPSSIIFFTGQEYDEVRAKYEKEELLTSERTLDPIFNEFENFKPLGRDYYLKKPVSLYEVPSFVNLVIIQHLREEIDRRLAQEVALR